MRWGIFIYVLMKERRWNLNPVSKFHSNSNKEKIKQMFEILFKVLFLFFFNLTYLNSEMGGTHKVRKMEQKLANVGIKLFFHLVKSKRH